MKKKTFKNLILAFATAIISFPVNGADFKADRDVVLNKDIDNDLYAAAASVTSNSVIYGDLVVAAGKISVNDTVHGDIMLAGSDLLVNSPVLDDAKLFGENINVLGNVKGDLIIFGGLIEINKDVTIERDLIVFGGYVVVNGKVNGNVIIKGGQVSLNGIVNGKVDVDCEELKIDGEINGPSELSAMEIEFGEGARFRSDVRYWTEDGEIDFEPYLSGATATYDRSLKIEGKDINWKSFGAGLAGFWLFFTLSVFLVILLLQLLFRKVFEKAAMDVSGAYVRNFGYGVLYFIGLPLLAVFFMVTIIGIPIGLLLMSLVGFSALFAFSITSVMWANWFKYKYNKKWNNWMVILIAALLFLGLRIILFIPAAGLLVNLIVISMAFGTLLNILVLKKPEEVKE